MDHTSEAKSGNAAPRPVFSTPPALCSNFAYPECIMNFSGRCSDVSLTIDAYIQYTRNFIIVQVSDSRRREEKYQDTRFKLSRTVTTTIHNVSRPHSVTAGSDQLTHQTEK